MESNALLHPNVNYITMKVLKTILIVLALFMVCAIDHQSVAQTTRQDKRAAKESEMKKVLESKNFTFTAQSVNPMRGATRTLTSEYDLRITPDTVIAYLPFFGRAYTAPIDPNEGGIKFTSTKFSYSAQLKKNGYQIIIKPADTKDVRQMVLDVSFSGYGTLSITNLNRDPISFYGTVDANKKPKK
ncbi:DUF4251 domain-containing protein [Mucilaginibacter boryungensis]